ncbi:MAG: hypothetical protein WDA70_12130 [Lysobacteraceae bacterium]
MSAIALLLPRLRRAQAPVPSARPVSAPVRGASAAAVNTIDWQHLAPALQTLGPVLHVDGLATGVVPELISSVPWPARPELLGLVCARRLVASVLVDSHGPRESLHFLGAGGWPLASIWLLPDSDFLAWERLLEHLPDTPTADVAWWQELPHHAPRGCARVRRFSSTRLGDHALIDAAPAAHLSHIGRKRARQIAAVAGARLDESTI